MQKSLFFNENHQYLKWIEIDDLSKYYIQMDNRIRASSRLPLYSTLRSGCEQVKV